MGQADLPSRHRACPSGWTPRIFSGTDPTKASTTLFDCVAVYLAYAEDWGVMEDLPIRVTDAGMTVVDPSKKVVRCAAKWNDLDALENHLVDRVCGTNR